MSSFIDQISLRPQYFGKRKWKYGCCFTTNYNYLDLLNQNINDNENYNNINININNESSLHCFDIPFYNKTSEYIKNIPKYIEDYNESNYDLMDKISHLYRNLLNSNDFYKVYIKKNSLKQFNNISRIATNKLHKTTIPDNTTTTTNTFNTLLKNNQKIIDDNKNNKNNNKLSTINFYDEEDIIDNRQLNNTNEDNFSDGYDPDDYCESSSYPTDDLDF